MAKRGSSYKVTKNIQTGTLQKAYTSDLSVAEAISLGEQVSGATAFAVAGWEEAKLETIVTAKSAAAEMKGAVIFRFGASLDKSSYDNSLITSQLTSNAWKNITMVISAATATMTQRRITSCDVAGLSTIKLLGVTNASSGAVGVNAWLIKAR